MIDIQISVVNYVHETSPIYTLGEVCVVVPAHVSNNVSTTHALPCYENSLVDPKIVCFGCCI